LIQAHRKVILLILSITVVVALVVSLVLPKQYKATSSVVLNYKASDPVTGLVVAPQALPGFMPTQVAIINSPSVALGVVDSLKLADQQEVKDAYADDNHGDLDIRNWLAALLLKKMDAVASKESSVIDITFKAQDPQFAALVANAFAASYQRVSMQLKLDPPARLRRISMIKSKYCAILMSRRRPSCPSTRKNTASPISTIAPMSRLIASMICPRNW
jgi:uncharacterized protein involved in exopolysaccharide biosynthesis